MASTLKVNTIQGASNTATTIKTNGGTNAMTIDTTGNVGIGTASLTNVLHVHQSDASANSYVHITQEDGGSSATDGLSIGIEDGGVNAVIRNRENGYLRMYTNNTERMRVRSDGIVLIGTTYPGIQVSGVSMSQDGNVDIGSDANPLDVNRQGNDGSLIRFYQAGSEEGEITVSGSTVSLSGFQGSHESSGIPSDTPIGTVVSTIDTIDTKTIIAEDGSKSQEDRADHPKIEVSSSVGDKAVYGVLARWRTIEENEDVKAMIASVGTGSVRVTGACAKGDLLESNGDGTAKVQSDDIIRSKTIGKVTIGNSDTKVKLVSCVLYCG